MIVWGDKMARWVAVTCAVASATAISACSTSEGMVKIPQRKENATAQIDAPSQNPQQAPGNPPSGGDRPSGPRTPPKGPSSPPLVTSIQPDLACATPQEDFDIMASVKARFGPEAEARLTKLVATDFKNSDLTAKDRQVLKYIARETLWIPPWLEERIGDAYFKALGGNLVSIGDSSPGQLEFAKKTLTDIVNVSPKTPFDIELMVVKDGTPTGSPGGRIFVDQPLVLAAKGAAVGSPRRDKLTYVFAHELAHIYKRHRAKRLQEQLISMQETRKILRILLSPSSATSSIRGFIEAVGATKIIVEGLLRHQADFLRAQEVEADACATALLMQSKLGDPVRGFELYSRERTSSNGVWTVYSEHPPDAQRSQIISLVARSGQSRRPVARDDVLNSLASHIRAASGRDR